MRDYYKQLYANKMDNLEKMDKFLEKHNLPKLNQEEIENTNRQSQALKLRWWFIIFQQTSAGPDGFTGEFYQTFRGELTPVFLKIFQKIAEEGTLPNSFYEATITQIPTPKILQKKKSTDQYHCWIYMQKSSTNTSKQNPTTHWKDHTSCSSGIYPRDARILQYMPINQCATPY